MAAARPTNISQQVHVNRWDVRADKLAPEFRRIFNSSVMLFPFWNKSAGVGLSATLENISPLSKGIVGVEIGTVTTGYNRRHGARYNGRYQIRDRSGNPVYTVNGWRPFCEAGRKFTIIAEVRSGNFLNDGTIFAKAHSDSTNREFQMYRNQANRIAFYIRGTVSEFNTASREVNGGDHQVAFTWDGITARLYLNGIYQTTVNVGTAAKDAGTAERFTIGYRSADSTAGFILDSNDMIYWLGCYNRDLTVAELSLIARDPQGQWRDDSKSIGRFVSPDARRFSGGAVLRSGFIG